MNKRSSGPKRGEIWIVNFDPTIGSEIKKTRPAVVIQNNIGNTYSPVTIVAALSAQYEAPLYPTEVLVESSEGGLRESSVVLLNQIRTIDKKRLIKKLGSLKSDTVQRIDRALQISLGFIEV